MPFEAVKNRLLRSLTEPAWEALAKHISIQPLGVRQRLVVQGRPPEHVHFPESGSVALVVRGRPGASIAVGLIGKDGAIGLANIMGQRPPFDAVVQMPGDAWRIRADDLLEVAGRSRELRAALFQCYAGILSQISQLAYAGAWHTIEERVAAWLCMLHDRSETRDLKLTHDTLALLLGVRRPGVTLALNVLTDTGAIKCGRGAISILDRRKLEIQAADAYSPERCVIQFHSDWDRSDLGA